MKASVLIPCHPRNRLSLPRTLESLEVARRTASETLGFDAREIEFVVAEDPEGFGPSWARNQALARAQGDFIFFCDADDGVEPDFFARPLVALAETEADFCLFSYAGGPSLERRVVESNAAVRAAFLPAFFGYSMDDVRRWNAGDVLARFKQPGQVWRGAFRRAFLTAHELVFDEAITLFEDAAFLSACAAFAVRVVELPDKLYRYQPRADGNCATGWRTRRNWDYKFVAHDFRRCLDARCGGALWPYCEASCVFSALELLRARYRVRDYLNEPRVRTALARFPLSLRHPLVALAVLFLRCR